MDTKDKTISKDTITKDMAKVPDGLLHGKQWNELIDLFEPINPDYESFYSNKTERSSLQYLAKKYGFEKTKRMLEALPGIVTQKYAPRITKPTELKRDIGKLVVFIKQQNNAPPKPDLQTVDRFPTK